MKRSIIITLAVATLIGGAGFYSLNWNRAASRELNQRGGVATAPPVTAPTPINLRKQTAVELIFADLPANATPRRYVDKIQTLGADVPELDQQAWIDWINGPKPSHLKDGSWAYVVNEVMDVLCQQHHPTPRWTQALIEISRSKTNIPLLRDYALQHLVDCLVPLSAGMAFQTDASKRQDIITAFVDAAEQSNETYSGTAIQGLHIILENHQRHEQSNADNQAFLAFTVGQLRPLAVNLVNSDEADTLARITALQVCAERGFTEVVKKAREIAVSSPVDSLRLSAIAVLGKFGTQEDQPLLEQILQTGSQQLQQAANPALQNIRKRLAASSSVDGQI